MGDPVTLLERLKDEYGVQDEPLHGQCIIVPAAKFHNDWSSELRELGCRIVQGNQGVHPVVFVSLPKTVAEPSTEAQAPEKHQPWLGKAWTKDEDKELIKGVTLGWNDAEIAKRIPNRTEVAVKQRRQRLEKHGVLPSKKTGKVGRPRKTATAAPERLSVSIPPSARDVEPAPVQGHETATSAPGSAPAPTPRTQPFTIHTTLCINLNVNCNDPFSVQNALKVIEEARRTR